jgi:histidinol dehydrogenase
LAILVTTRPELASQVIAEVKLQSKANAIARQSLAANGYVFLASSLQEAQEITNRLAPEHLTVDDPSDTQWVQNAGSIFIGSLSPQAMGDYVSGPNHTLPTGGFARVRGGLGALDFVKLITVQQYDEPSLQKLGPSAIALAEAEGLLGHAAAIRARGIASGDTSAKTMRGKAYA